jgi:hypothetical protein
MELWHRRRRLGRTDMPYPLFDCTDFRAHGVNFGLEFLY